MLKQFVTAWGIVPGVNWHFYVRNCSALGSFQDGANASEHRLCCIFPLLFDALLLIDSFSFRRQGHLRAHEAISTGVPLYFAERHEDPSRKRAELGGFRSLAGSPAVGHFLLHTVLSDRRVLDHF